MNIANYLSCMRIFIGPIFLFFYLESETIYASPLWLPCTLLFLFAIAELSDVCDGFLARKYNQVTDLGKILDPMADSIYRLSVFFIFTYPPIRLPLFFVFILFYRDSIISTLRTVCALKGIALGARPSGKLKTGIQAFSIFVMILLLIPYSLGTLPEETLHLTSVIIVAVTSLYTIFSGIDYLYANWGHVSGLLYTRSKKVVPMTTETDSSLIG